MPSINYQLIQYPTPTFRSRVPHHRPGVDPPSSCATAVAIERSARADASPPSTPAGSGGRSQENGARHEPQPSPRIQDRKSGVEGKSVSVRVDIGGGRIIKKNMEQIQHEL